MSHGLTPEQARLRARMGGLALVVSGKTNTAPAREKFNARFYEGIPEDLPEAERDRRAAAARKLYFTGLAMKSARARAAKKAS